MKTRSVTAITPRRSNERGDHYFMSLNMGCILHSYQWQDLPITNTVIDSVEEMATSEEAPEMIDGYPNFYLIPIKLITDGYYNEKTTAKTNDDEYEY